MSEEMMQDDFEAIIASDRWLDEVAGGFAAEGDLLAEQLVEWLDVIDREHRMPAAGTPTARFRISRTVAAGCAAAVMAVTAGAAAAAVPGSPIHQLVFGTHPAATVAASERRAAGLLDLVATQIADAQASNSPAPPLALPELADATAILTPLPNDPTRSRLLDRAGYLRTVLISWPAPTATPAPTQLPTDELPPGSTPSPTPIPPTPTSAQPAPTAPGSDGPPARTEDRLDPSSPATGSAHGPSDGPGDPGHSAGSGDGGDRSDPPPATPPATTAPEPTGHPGGDGNRGGEGGPASGSAGTGEAGSSD